MKIILVHQSLWNLMGFALPSVAAIIATPFLLQQLGNDDFGALSIVWVVFGVAGMMDFGIGRALTIIIASLLAKKCSRRILVIFSTSVVIAILVSVVGFGLFMIATMLSSQLSGSNYWWVWAICSVSLFFIIRGAILRGVLEGYKDFQRVSVSRSFFGCAMFFFPCIATYFSKDMNLVVGSILAARITANGIMNAALRRHGLRSLFLLSYPCAKQLIGIGGWITVSNIIGPLIVYSDRFFISILLSVTQLTYFSVPADAVSRVLVIPNSVALAAFPYIAANPRDQSWLKMLIYRSTLMTVAVLLPLVLAIVYFSYDILQIWLGRELAEQSSVTLRILAISFLVGGLAQVPFSALQAMGHAKQPAIWHLIQCLPYFGLLYLFTSKFGIEGAAYANLTRIAIDTTAMWFLLWRSLKRFAQEAAN